ncbi:MAG: TonB-dependent receptor plug domain-containing protein [Vicingaceae bacterium]|nr:TonB-dependent receptor plug domain-containing protein [Vicingaceae bacterium]
MNKALLLSVSLLFVQLSFSQVGTITIFEKESKESIIGATLYIESIEKGGVSDLDGKIVIEDIPQGEYEVKISFIGFESIDTIIQFPLTVNYTFYLEEGENELEEFTVSTTRSTRTIENIPTRMEFIGGEELGEKAVMNSANISMVLRESTGIQMQQTSINSGNTNIKIQGLDGRYTQLLKDGFPLYGGFSGGLSIMQIPPLDLKQFGIIKGSSSTLYGGGAIAGLVNMVSKTPEEEPSLDIMLTQTHALGSTGNIFFSKRGEKIGYTIYASGNSQTPYDPDGDGFSNLPLAKTVTFNPKLFYYPSEKTTFWFGLNGTYDKRTGGDLEVIENGVGGINQFSESNESKRGSTQAVYETKFSKEKKLEIKNSISFFDRDLKIPNYSFKGSQTNSFTELNYQLNKEKAEWIFGANLYTINFDEVTDSISRDSKEMVEGIFANSIIDVSKKVVLETGVRVDYSDKWGVFPLPKISILYKPTNKFTTRLGGGLGYKIPDIFTEEAEQISYRNILPIDVNSLNAEKSLGGNVDFNYKTSITDELFFSVNQLFYLTSINDALLLNTNSNGYLQFENANGSIMSKGAETNVKFTYKDFRWIINYAFIEATLDYLPNKPQKPLTAKHNAGTVLMYESEKWRIGYEAYYTGEQTLSNGSKTNDFVTMGLMVMRNFKWGSVFANFENFTDVRQANYSPEVLGTIDNPVFPEIYAPTDGVIVSVGLLIRPFGNEDDDD